MSEGGGSRKVRKSGSPKVLKKSEVGSPNVESENSSAIDTPHSEIKEIADEINKSEINKSELTKSEIENPTSEITMEVHHHPEVEKKGLKEYFLEGLMIFLAVTMGFFAESYREHIADRHREKEYMSSMVEDLKSDTASFNGIINYDKSHDHMIDSLILMLGSPGLKNNENQIYFFARQISIPEQVFFNDRTIQQLKSSGSLRLISNSKVSDEIMTYDERIRVQYFEMNDEVMLRADYRQLAEKIFDTKVFNSMVVGDKITPPTNNPPLFSTEPALINAYMGSAQYLKKLNERRVKRTGELLVRAKQLIELIKSQYHLEDE